MRGINRINSMLEMPKEIYTKEPKVVTIGFNELIIENYKGILEYEESYVKIGSHIGNVIIHGIDLKIDKMTEENVKILGKIESINIERK